MKTNKDLIIGRIAVFIVILIFAYMVWRFGQMRMPIQEQCKYAYVGGERLKICTYKDQ